MLLDYSEEGTDHGEGAAGSGLDTRGLGGASSGTAKLILLYAGGGISMTVRREPEEFE